MLLLLCTYSFNISHLFMTLDLQVRANNGICFLLVKKHVLLWVIVMGYSMMTLFQNYCWVHCFKNFHIVQHLATLEARVYCHVTFWPAVATSPVFWAMLYECGVFMCCAGSEVRHWSGVQVSPASFTSSSPAENSVVHKAGAQRGYCRLHHWTGNPLYLALSIGSKGLYGNHVWRLLWL